MSWLFPIRNILNAGVIGAGPAKKGWTHCAKCGTEMRTVKRAVKHDPYTGEPLKWECSIYCPTNSWMLHPSREWVERAQ